MSLVHLSIQQFIFSLTLQIFIDCLPSVRHCSNFWGGGYEKDKAPLPHTTYIHVEEK